jgi:hypothetical protein
MYRILVVYFFVKSFTKLLDFTSIEALRIRWKSFDVDRVIMIGV